MLKKLFLCTQNLTLLEDQGLWIQAIVLHCSCAKAASSGIRARFTFQDQLFKWSQGKVLSNPQDLFSCTSMNHGSDDRLKCPLVVEFSEFSGQLHIEEFLDWLIEVERFFEDRNIAKKQQFKFVESKLKGEAWAWWEQLQRMRTRLGKVPIEDWIKMKKYLKRRFLPPDYRDLMFQEFQVAIQFLIVRSQHWK